jgi:hypothetical protein
LGGKSCNTAVFGRATGHGRGVGDDPFLLFIKEKDQKTTLFAAKLSFRLCFPRSI